METITFSYGLISTLALLCRGVGSQYSQQALAMLRPQPLISVDGVPSVTLHISDAALLVDAASYNEDFDDTFEEDEHALLQQVYGGNP